MRCSALQCVAVRCNVLQSIAVWVQLVHCNAINTLQCDQYIAMRSTEYAEPDGSSLCCSILQRVTTCCTVLQHQQSMRELMAIQCVAVCCSVLQCVQVCSVCQSQKIRQGMRYVRYRILGIGSIISDTWLCIPTRAHNAPAHNTIHVQLSCVCVCVRV